MGTKHCVKCKYNLEMHWFKDAGSVRCLFCDKVGIWFNVVNYSGGLHWSTPHKAKPNRYEDYWVDSSGNYLIDFKKLGMSGHPEHCLTFSSYDKKEVELFTAGALAITLCIKTRLPHSTWRYKELKEN